MRAAYLTGPEQIDLGEFALPEPGPGRIRIAVESCGICGSNLHGWRHPELGITKGDGPEPGAAGHEIAGTLEDGTLVVVEPNLTGACGACAACESGTAWFCRNRTTVPSWGFADAMVVPEAAVFAVPAGVAPATATLTEPLACAVHAFRWSFTGRTRGLEGLTVAVLGSGVAGLLTQVTAREMGAATVLASARYPHQAVMSAALGADEVVDSGEAADRFRRAGPDVVVEAVGGTAPTFGEALRIVAPAGEVIGLGLFDIAQSLDVRRSIFREQRLFFPVTYGLLDGVHDYDVALAILGRRRDDLDDLITHRFPLDEVAEAFRSAADKTRGGLRTVVGP
ncbi:MAG TPA: zinc-binding dehydrogenase [Acidimicrobiia bacterium]|nr:zinc-binding dehydrogenase [Acidimicrobiia bacterium]